MAEGVRMTTTSSHGGSIALPPGTGQSTEPGWGFGKKLLFVLCLVVGAVVAVGLYGGVVFLAFNGFPQALYVLLVAAVIGAVPPGIATIRIRKKLYS
jgi:hypothetical protein